MYLERYINTFMKNIYAYVLVAGCWLFFSCKKEIKNTSSISDEISSLSTEDARWQGAFLSYNGLPKSRYGIPDNLFIRDGYARIYSDSVKINKDNYYSTKIWLVIPESINIKGDSLNFEAGLRNSFNSSFYSPDHGRDIKMYVKGETNEGFINNVATSDIDPDGLERAAISIGQTVKNNLTQLQHNFQNYDTLILQTFNHGIVAYRNNTILTGLAYEREPNIGRLKEIGIEFKGSGFINYIKIYNSVTGKLLMSERFNMDGQSTVVWHMK